MGWLRCVIEQLIKSHDERHQGLGLGVGHWQRDRMLWNGVMLCWISSEARSISLRGRGLDFWMNCWMIMCGRHCLHTVYE